MDTIQILGGLVVAFTLSIVGALPAGALGRRFQLKSRQRTGEGRRRRTASYAGGLLVAASASGAFWLAHGLSWTTSAAIGAAWLFFLLGLIREHSGQPALSLVPRFAVELLAAVAAVMAGFRPGVLQPIWLDGVLAVALLLLGVKSFASLEVSAGAATPPAAATAGALLLLGVISGQTLVSVLAASLCGACLGFLIPAFGRERLSLGRAGSQFLGFLLMATALVLREPGGGASTLVALFCCFSVPFGNVGIIAISRFLAGRRIRRSSSDGVVQRLAQLGLSRRSNSLVLVGAAAGGGAAAVISVRWHTFLPTVLALTIFGAGAILLQRVEVYDPAPPRRGRQVALGLVVACVLALGVSLGAALIAQRDLVTARTDLLAARSALTSLNGPRAQVALDRARPEMDRAEGRLSSWATLPARLVPGLGNNLLVATALARSGQDLISAGRQGVQMLEALKLQQGHGLSLLGNGGIDLQPFAQAQGPAASLDQTIVRAQSRLAASPSSFLVPQVGKARAEAMTELAKARKVADAAQVATSFLPDALGKGSPQTWVIGAEDNAEARGRGGYMGAMGVVTADNGKVSLTAFADTADLPKLPPTATVTNIPSEYPTHYAALGAFGAWQNLTMSPSFASGGRLLLSMLQSSGALQPTGLVGLDPEALANLLAVTGPVSVAGIPEPLTSANVVDWALNKIFFLYPNGNVRHDVLATVAQAVWQRMLSGSVDPRHLANAMSRSLAGDHLSIYSTDPAIEALASRLGLGGELDKAPGDYLLVVGQNVGENKLDYYAQRRVSYEAQVADDDSAEVTLKVALTNSAPVGVSLPNQLGGARPLLGLPAGTNRTYLSAMVPEGAVLEDVQVDGTSTKQFENVQELGKRLFAVYLQVGPGQTSTVQFRYAVPKVVVGGQYRLTVQNQASVHPDELTVGVQAPKNAVVVADQGFRSGDLVWGGNLTAQKAFMVDLRQGLLANLSHGLEAILNRSVAPYAK